MVDALDDREVQLVSRAQRGDATAFCSILRVYDLPLRRLAYRVVGTRDLMEEVLQEAYIKGFASVGQFEFTRSYSLQAWLHRLVYTVAIDELRRGRRHSARAATLSEVPDGSATTPENQALLRVAVTAALADLPPHQRALLALVDEAGFDYAAAAQILGVPRGTVASGLNRARATLRNQLRDWEVRDG